MNEFLRAIDPNYQVMILFGVVFAVLLLGTVAVVLQQVYTPDDADHAERRKQLAHRQKMLGTSWGMMAVFWLSWVLGETASVILFALVSFYVLREFITLSPTHHSDHRSLVLVFFV
ncbi:MAG: phosphatidate cytidylyltransferase, partial [Brachymonas sp.]|nr:phosphatidate cytidylyltransferase [Brachymonas sp.]